MKKLLFTFSIVFLLILSACSPAGDTSNKIKVIATLFPQYDFVRMIAQDKVDVQLLLPPGVESHSYDPTPATIVNIGAADIFIYTNPEMEPWIEKIVDTVKNDSLLIVNSSEGIKFIDDTHDHDDDHNHDDDHDHGEYDPHVWLDPINAKVMVKNILNALIQADPANVDFYTINAQEVLDRLDELDEAFEEAFSLSTHKTIIYGGHFAFGYLADRHNIRILSPYVGFAPDAEPTPRAIAELIDTMNSLGISTIYYEELIDPKTARVISEQTGAEMVLLHGAHNVTKEEMESNISYFDIMFENVEKLKNGFRNE